VRLLRIASSITTRDRTPFIGRAREKALLLEDLERGTGFVTVAGPSGIGKTRLAKQVAGEIAPTFVGSGGTWFCSLAGCQSAADVEAVVARTLGIPQRQGEELARAIAAKGPTLLILDNVDSVASLIGDLVGRWLDLCIELQMLATSIIPLQLEGEVCIELGPLEAEDAVALYMERAHRAWAGRSFTPAEEPAVEELVQRLDRIPLAIELAAARIRVLPPKTLLTKIGRRLELLRSSTPGRHGSLLQALTLTWELLPTREQAILAKASLFDGGFSYEAAIELLGDDADEAGILELLDGLRAKALLQLDESEPPRFHLFESVQEYACLELERSGSQAESQARHAAFFLTHGEVHAAAIEGENALESTRWIKNERENLLAIHQRTLAVDPAQAARAGLVLAPLILMEGHPPSESHLLKTTLDAARRSGEPHLIIRALHTRSHAICQHGQIGEGLELLEEALELARKIGDRKEEGNLLVRIASLYQRSGDIVFSLPLLEQALRMGREEREPLVEGMALLVQGESALRQLSLDQAEQLFQASLDVFRRHGLVKREALALISLGVTWSGQGRWREARRVLQDAIEVSRKLENRSYEANALTNLGCVELDAGALEEAEASLHEAMKLQREQGKQISWAIAHGALGILALEQGEGSLAESRLNKAEGILAEAGAKGHHAEFLTFIAVLEARRGRLDEARRSLERARSYFESVGDEASTGQATLVEGVLEVAQARSLGGERSEEVEELIDRARERLSKLPEQPGAAFFGVTRRLLEQDLALWAAGLRETGIREPSTGIRVGRDADWFEVLGSPRVDLRRRSSLRRIFDTLANQRLASPGVPLGPEALFDVGWPKSKLDTEAALKRVYYAIWSLREMGLSDLLLHQTDGYLLDPKVPLLRQL